MYVFIHIYQSYQIPTCNTVYFISRVVSGPRAASTERKKSQLRFEPGSTATKTSLDTGDYASTLYGKLKAGLNKRKPQEIADKKKTVYFPRNLLVSSQRRNLHFIKDKNKVNT